MSVTNIAGNQTLAAGSTGVFAITGTGAINVTVPAGTSLGQHLIFKDNAGNAGANNKTITCQPNVDGVASVPLASNFASIGIIWLGTRWGTV